LLYTLINGQNFYQNKYFKSVEFITSYRNHLFLHKKANIMQFFFLISFLTHDISKKRNVNIEIVDNIFTKKNSLTQK
jgi:hypothetical protein